MSAKLILYLFLAVWTVRLDCEVYRDRPKIESTDGNLILRPGFNKNIYLKQNGPQSNIFVGQVNFLNLIFSNASGAREPFGDRQSAADVPDDILRRLETLESFTSNLQYNLSNINFLSRRVSRLMSRVSTIQARLNGLVRDECQSQRCQHGGTCLNLVDGYHCLCPPNWEGKNCEIDVNECRNFAGTDLGCQNGATCINRPGTYECLCRPGWFGLHCTRRAKDCQEGDYEMCGHGICIKSETGEGIKCICNQGWTSNGTGVACLTDVDECDTSQGARCSVNPKVDCINIPGSFRCGRCPSGYDGDGFVCQDIDECVTIPNGGCSTSPTVSCHNTIGSRVCGPCPTGYEGDGVTCTWRGSCFVNNGGCHPSARCVDTTSLGLLPMSRCQCPQGMFGNGIGIHGCYISTSSNASQQCEGNPCGPNGQCHSFRMGYSCVCFQGYRGAHCDKTDNICLTNPCQNGGTCRLDIGSEAGFRCECTAMYSGVYCQVHSKSCGGVLDAEEGSIVYPISNTTYEPNSRCAWVIHTKPDKVINVTFSKFNLEDDGNCLYDFLQIHDGRSSASQLIGRFCGNRYPMGGNILSSHNNLYFWFRSDRTVAKEGFALHWTSVNPICGGEIDATTHGHISSPGSPGPYPPNRDCYWNLTTSLGKRIQLHFFAFDIEIHSNCSFDYVAVYDGEHATDPLLGKFCNSTQPAPIQSAGSEILIHFHSDALGSGKGFQISFAPADGVPGCGGYYTNDKGEVTSPSYDNKYLSNLLCDYKIQTAPETQIRIDFKSFKLERSLRCRYDYLKVYDGPTSDSPLVGKYCGDTYPKSYTSSSNTLFIRFKTDHSIGADGFKISYQSICHSTIFGDSGVVKSPGYPFNYPSNKMCEYIIRTNPGRSIALTFQDFDIEGNYNCHYDYVEVRDGLDRNATLLGQFCGGSDRTPPTLTSSFNYMYIKFKSDLSLSGAGFYANYTTVDTKCGGIHREPSGTINHPVSGDTYDNDDSCTWIIVAPEGMHIMLTWNRFELDDIYCSTDFVQIIEMGNDMTNNLLATYCGTSLPLALTVTSNRLMIKFKSDRSITASGFSFSYSFVDENHCGGYYVRPHGYIYSPGWPGPYESNRNCNWTITVPVGQQILINITKFDIERPLHDRCDFGDYLEIRNGPSNTSPLIGTYCGTFAQKQIISTANSVYLYFHSDFYLTGTGFVIEWDGSIIGCGGTSTSISGLISSPNYPGRYNENAECFYKIITSSGSRIRISFSELELEHTAGCTDDYVEIFNGRDPNSASFGKFCDMTSNLKFETTSNFAFIKFRSDYIIGAKGFLLNYETICHNNVSGSYGVIESPGFPNKYPSNSNCTWTITVSKGSKINITFTHFDITTSYYRPYYSFWSRYRPIDNIMHARGASHPPTLERPCVTDYLQIKEASDKSITKKFCGSSIPPQSSSSSNSLEITFVSSFAISRTGFRLEWSRYGCGGHIQKFFGTINLKSSEIIPGEMECDWIIETPTGTSIYFSIPKLTMTSSTNCSTDALEIYNGQSVSSPLITKICHEGEHEASTTGNLMFVRFSKKSLLRNIRFSLRFLSTDTSCGGRINTRSGFIYSKNYPKNYDNNLDCIWVITVPQNHRIEFNIVDLDLYELDGLEDCSDVINIFDGGELVASNRTNQICSVSNTSELPIHFVTKTNVLAVQFITNNFGTAKGFKANFTTSCGSVVEAIYDGVLKSDKFISHSTRNCTWIITAPTLNQKIKLTITHMSIAQNTTSSRRCESFLKVFDGNDDSAPLIGEYCGRIIPPMLVSRGSAMTVQFGTYTNMIDGHFSAHYSSLTNACGGDLTSEEGNIASPNYPLSYPVNADCEWILSTSPGNRVYITFENFDLQYSEGCNEDYLEVRKNSEGGQLLGVYCGNDIPTNTTSATKLYIKFHSNDKNAGQGFIAHYGFLHGNDITDLERGEIASPLYPHPFEGPGVYTWRIMTAGFGTISINIDRLEIHQHEDLCTSYLTIYDGYDSDAPVLETLCGILINPKDQRNVQTTSTAAFIVLTLTDGNTDSLFHLRWAQSTRDIKSKGSKSITSCGSKTTELIAPGDYVTFNSPNYPDDYGNELNCEWVFQSSPGHHLRLRFQEISLEETSSCHADYISVYSSDNLIQWTPIKEHICSSENIHNHTDISSYLKVTFTTDTAISRRGFRGKVKSMCGGVVRERSGLIELSWSDLRNQDRVTKCEWTVKVRPGRNAMLKFIHFNITNSEKECNTYVLLRNGPSIEAPLLGKYCGYSHENREDIITSGNAVYITYDTSHYRTNTFQNFALHYEEKNIECGATSTLGSIDNWEIISTPNYPSSPVPYTECVWLFTGPPGEILRIDFIDRFDVRKDSTCSQEYVEIRDGSTNYSPLLGRFCGDKPGTTKTNNHVMYIKYVTQLVDPRDGFKANISVDLCGGTIEARAGEIISPNYPNINLRYGTVCKWHIISRPRHAIKLQFKDLDLPESETPCATKVIIAEPTPENNTLTKLHTVCDMDTVLNTDPIETFTNEVIIEFHLGKTSEYSQISESRGFRLAFNSSRLSCDGDITTAEGFLTTPGYPHKTALRYCQWKITVPDKTRRVHLELIDFDVDHQDLTFYNDLHFHNVIESVSKDAMPRNIDSSGNELAFYLFVKNHNILHRFKAKFSSNEEALCGGDLSGLTGQLESPILNRSYSCQWKYNDLNDFGNYNSTLQYNSILLNVRMNSTLTRSVCRLVDSVLTITAKAENGKIDFSRKVCSNTNVSLRLPSTSILIHATKNGITNFKFHIDWYRQPCGGVVHVGQEIIDVFNLPINYTESLDCAWILVIPAGIRLEIKLNGAFLLDCVDENLQISQGSDETAPIIGEYCRDNMPNNLLSTSFKYTYIQYHSKVQNDRQIKLTARTVSDQCGGFLTEYDRMFNTPNYPKGYPNNVECTWVIQADVGNRVSLQFIERFAIETTPNCTKDVVIIYDWTENDAFTEVARVCGRHTPDTFNSTANKIKVTLRTDDSIYLDGFRARWKPICGGKFLATDEKQYIFSPGYPHNYLPLLNCIYEITGSGKTIALDFEDFEFEGTFPECRYDNITITAEGRDNYVHEVYCGNEMPKRKANIESAKITLKTDVYTQRRGFKLSYSTVSCGSIIRNTTLISSGPNDLYDNNMNCSWIIDAPTNKIIVFKILYMDLENYGECYNDYLSIFEGPEINENRRLALLCGHLNTTTTVRSKGNKAVLQFVTDSNISYKGFKAEVFFSYSESVGCGGRVNLTSDSRQIIKSPLLGANVLYENFLDCNWEVMASIDYVIKVDFESFHVAPCENVNQTALGSSKCDCDVLEIRDGLNPNNLIIGRYCGHTAPTPLLSSRNMISIRLSTDGEINSSGFRVILTKQRSLCSHSSISVSHEAQKWTSPGYETGSIPRGLHCSYDLDTRLEPYNTVQVTIHNLDLESPTGGRCVKDKLVIIGNSESKYNVSAGQDVVIEGYRDNFFSHAYLFERALSFPLHFELCGSTQSVDFYVQKRTSINLMTSPDTDVSNHRGVEIEVKYLGFCGRNYTGKQGRVQFGYQSLQLEEEAEERDCYTLITAPENHTISAYFISVSPEYYDDKVFLKIYDGNDTNSNLLSSIVNEYTDSPIFSSGRYLLLHNRAHGFNMVTFDLNYVTTDRGRGCGGTLHNIVGKITSPLYPDVFRRRTACEWELQTPVGTRLFLHFSTFSLGITCDQNYVELQDRNGNSITKYCEEQPADYMATDNFVKVLFVTTMNNGGPGWVAEFVGVI